LFIVIGFPGVPEPNGCNSPINVSPDLKRIISLGKNVVALTFVKLCHAVEGESPSLVSIPLVASTNYSI
jgi:hypothetical protein